LLLGLGLLLSGVLLVVGVALIAVQVMSSGSILSVPFTVGLMPVVAMTLCVVAAIMGVDERTNCARVTIFVGLAIDVAFAALVCTGQAS